jgi:hypothetical protein
VPCCSQPSPQLSGSRDLRLTFAYPTHLLEKAFPEERWRFGDVGVVLRPELGRAKRQRPCSQNGQVGILSKPQCPGG